MTAITTDKTLGWLRIELAGVAATTGGAIASVANPEGFDLIITQAVLYVRTPSTGGSNITIGVGSTATATATDLCNALAINTVTKTAYNLPVLDAKTALPALWRSTYYVVAEGSATSVGFVGDLFIQYIRTETAV